MHPDYEAYVRGEKREQLARTLGGDHAAVKRENDYLKQHYKNICVSDAVLVVNLEKNGVKNYIGGNVLIEMGQAFVNEKAIFLLNSIPEAVSYRDELLAMAPNCLDGNLSSIRQAVAGNEEKMKTSR